MTSPSEEARRERGWRFQLCVPKSGILQLWEEISLIKTTVDGAIDGHHFR